MIKKFSVQGMSCSACSAGIERNLLKETGINSVSVSLIEKSMTVDFDEQKTSVEKIIAIVEKLGYSASLYGAKKLDKYKDANAMKKRFLFSLCLLLPLMYLCMGHFINLPLPKKALSFTFQWLLATLILILNRKFFINGTKALSSRAPNMDTLVSLGSLSAYVYSVTVTVLLYLKIIDPAHTFFEGSAMVVTLVTLGKWLEELSKIKTGDAIDSLSNLLPKTATIMKNGKQVTVLTTELKVGDVVVLKAGDYVSVDGVVIEGQASVDKSAITGESMPEEVSVGMSVSSGSILKEGYLYLKAECVGESTLFSKIIEIVRTAGASKAPVQRFADKVAGVFVPIVTAISLITFVVWLITTREIFTAFNYGISVLVISCPCALGLATPVAIMAGTGNGASQGILFKNAETLQIARKIDRVLLDKTATITQGKVSVTDYENFTGESTQTLFPLVSALESKSNHPLAKSVINYCGDTDKKVECYEYVSGKGVTGEIDGAKYFLGNKDLLPDNLRKDDNEYLQKYFGKTLLFFADEYQIISLFALADLIKDDSASAVESLKSHGIKVVMLTGDNQSTAQSIAKQVGIDEFVAEILPQDKYSIVEKYKEKGYFTAMVGDGINDSPALKSADIGIAMGTGTDIAMDSSDVVIANGSLTAIKKAIDLSAKTYKIIKQNLFWAFFYNIIGIPVAGGALAFLGISLTPAIASIMMSISSLFVVTNALRISKKREKKCAVKKIKTTLEIFIDGMHCNNCVNKVEKAFLNLSQTVSVSVSLSQKKATLSLCDKVALDKIQKLISDLGFKVIRVLEHDDNSH